MNGKNKNTHTQHTETHQPRKERRTSDRSHPTSTSLKSTTIDTSCVAYGTLSSNTFRPQSPVPPPVVTPRMNSDCKQVAVHVLDHALEFANPCASRLLPSTIPLLLEASSDDDPSVSLVSSFCRLGTLFLCFGLFLHLGHLFCLANLLIPPSPPCFPVVITPPPLDIDPSKDFAIYPLALSMNERLGENRLLYPIWPPARASKTKYKCCWNFDKFVWYKAL